MSRRPAPRWTFLSALLTLCFATAGRAAVPVAVEDVRLWSGPEGTRLVLDLSAPVRHELFSIENPERVVIDLQNARLAMRKPLPDGQGPVTNVRSGPQADGGLRIVLDLTTRQPVKSFMVAPEGGAGHRLVVEMPPVAAAARATAPQTPLGQQVLTAGAAAMSQAAAGTPPVKSITSNAKGRDLVVAIDAGHGGQDPGAIGRGGTREKDVTLAIARRLAVLIRDGDYFISLRGRIRKARESGADMFISVHADAVPDRNVSGASVYVLSLRGASDEASRWLAERENAADLMGGVSLDDKNDVLASVLLDVTQKEAVSNSVQKEAVSNSVEAADAVLGALRRVGKVHGSHRVRHAGFVVLKSPDIPSMLVETAFISNAGDERKLRDPAYQQRVAEAIHGGVRDFFYDKPPPGTKLAAIVATRRGGATPAQTLAER